MPTFQEQREQARKTFAKSPELLAQTLQHIDGMERLLGPSRAPASPREAKPFDREAAVRERVLAIRAGNPGTDLASAHRLAVEDVSYARDETPTYSQADLATLSGEDRADFLSAALRGEIEVEDPEPAQGSDAWFEAHPEGFNAVKERLGITDEYLNATAAGRQAISNRNAAAKQARTLAENRRATQVVALMDGGLRREEAEKLVPSVEVLAQLGGLS